MLSNSKANQKAPKTQKNYFKHSSQKPRFGEVYFEYLQIIIKIKKIIEFKKKNKKIIFFFLVNWDF